MKNNSQSRIRTISDLHREKHRLEQEVRKQEEEILGHPIVTIPAALFETRSFKNSVHKSVESFSLEHYKSALTGLISSILLSNPRTRKFYIGFVIARELVPFALKKIEEMLKK